jgi:fibronectin-binding autotransporter adhesin
MRSPFQLVLACTAWLTLVPACFGQTSGSWNIDADGNWSAAASWTNGTIPNGIGHTASFVKPLSADRTVTLDVPVTLGRLIFNRTSGPYTTNRYVLAGPNALRLDASSGNAMIEVESFSDRNGAVDQINAPVVLVDNLDVQITATVPPAFPLGDASLVIRGNISEATAGRTVTKSLPGLLVFQGTNTYTGSTTVAEGELRLDHTFDNGAKLSPTSTLVVGGKTTVSLVGNSAGSTATVATTTLNSASTFNEGSVTFRVVDADTSDSNTTVLDLGTINFGSGTTTTLFFRSAAAAGTANFSQGRIKVNNTPVNGILSGRALAAVGNGTSFSDFAGVDAGGFIMVGPAGGYTSQNDATVWAAGQNISTTGAMTGTAPTVAINTLRVNAGAANNTLTIGSGNTLTLSAGGLLITDNVGAFPTRISGGFLSAGTQPLVIHQWNGNLGQDDHRLTIDSHITGSGALIKEGLGVLELTNAASNYSGATVIRSGALRIFNDVPFSGDSPVGASSIFRLGDLGTDNRHSPQLLLAGNLTFARNIEANSESTVLSFSPEERRLRIAAEGGVTASMTGTIGYSNGVSLTTGRGLELTATSAIDRLVVHGVITGVSSDFLYVNGRNSGIGTVHLSANNNFLRTVISNGTLEVGATVAPTGQSPVGTSSIIEVGDVHTPADSTQIRLLLAANVTFNRVIELHANSASLTPDRVTIGSLEAGSSSFTRSIEPDGALKDWNLRFHAGTGATTVSFTDNIFPQPAFSGPAGTYDGVLHIEKTGPGVVVLSDSNTYEGGTTVNEGTLLVNNTTGSGTGTAVVVVNEGKLGGTGTIGGNVLVNSATIDPGVTTGRLSVLGQLQLTANSTAAFQLGGGLPGNGAGFYDQLTITSSATLDGILLITTVGNFDPTGGTFFLLGRGSGAGDGTTFAGLPEGSQVFFDDGKYTGFLTYHANWTGDQATSTLTGGNDVALFSVVSAVPEPATLAAIALPLAGGCFWWLRRRRHTRDLIAVDEQLAGEPELD